MSRHRQSIKISCILADGKWHNLRQIARRCRLSTAGCSARIRDLRKAEHGHQTVIVKPAPRPGPFLYRLVSKVPR